MKPLLQIALDNISMEDALKMLSGGIGDAVDIIEAGTLLLAAEGHRCVKILRALYPEKLIVADLKLADAGKVLSAMMLDSGADFISVICAADPKTMALANEEAIRRGKETQIELYGPWTKERAQQWHDIGMPQIIYHHSRDAGQPWGDIDLENIKMLCDIGYKVTVTGGLAPKMISLFKGLPVFAFIAGRALSDSEHPIEVVQEFKEQINSFWN